MKQNSATRRLAEEAREKIATILMMEISDPRLDLVTVTGCEVSVDRSVCKVWVSADPDSYDEVLEGLQSAKGRIRSLLGRSLTWRVTPELIFQIDRSTDEAQRIAEALKNVPPTMSIPKDEFGYPLPAEEEGSDADESEEVEAGDENL
ncbi:MAG: 30S ribosome-binding factor RbfA [Coriobacteriaceae bacterium]|nr:30S ribosome-binding factor RbfA [Coriobacteriaceae bacterium]MDY5809486.1 30S ribosome-binding factor RbfA [Coriobacteriales bacterium]